MKEKRVDFYLALAFFQILIVGAVGALFTELFKSNSDKTIIYGAGLAIIALGAIVIHLYIKVNRLTRKNKKIKL